jgi:hypothetical protein
MFDSIINIFRRLLQTCFIYSLIITPTYDTPVFNSTIRHFLYGISRDSSVARAEACSVYKLLFLGQWFKSLKRKLIVA